MTTPDYGTVVLRRDADGLVHVESWDEVIGVTVELLEEEDFGFYYDGEVLTLGSTGQHRYRRAHDSATTPGVIVFHRLPDAQSVTADPVTDGG